VYFGIAFCVCYVELCCVYGRNRQAVQCDTVTVLHCVKIFIIVLGVDCFTYSNVVFMKGTDRQ